MSTRDALTDKLAECAAEGMGAREIADALLAAGFCGPARVIEDPVELDELPLGSICRTDRFGGDVWHRLYDAGWATSGSGAVVSARQILQRGPATVLHTPENGDNR